MTYVIFQHEIALKLLENPELFSRKKVSEISIASTINTKKFTLTSAHGLVKRSKKGYYNAYKITKERPAKRQIIGEINQFGNKRQKKGSQTWYGYTGCVNSYYHQKGDCFEAIHT